MTDGDDEHNPISTAPFKEFLRDQTDKRVGTDASDRLNRQLLGVAQCVWKRAGELAEEQDYKTIQEQHVKTAYDEFVQPQAVLMDAADKIDSAHDQVIEQAERTPLYRQYDD